MIVVTGGAGFIGSALVWELNERGHTDILVVDHLGTSEKWKNLVPRRFSDYLDRAVFLEKLEAGKLGKIETIFHLGACSATTELDADYLMENNYRYTKTLAEYAMQNNIRFIYASSAATYGEGELGFRDTHLQIPNLRPLNMYGYSKQMFDLWALHNNHLDKMVGVKFFNVFGPNEYHKKHMMSMFCRAFEQIRNNGYIELFQSYNPEYADGGQKRDFVYIKDCVKVLYWFSQTPNVNGIFNLGTGKARTWNDLAHAMFPPMLTTPDIRYIPMPDALKGKYQYFTEASMDKLREAGYSEPFFSLEDAAKDYVSYLVRDNAVL
jgi:ADP-L-glycero-D-manno-heptose 6-epimerase